MSKNEINLIKNNAIPNEDYIARTIFFVKYVDKPNALPGDVLTYNLYYKQLNSNFDIYTAKTIFVDTLPLNTELIDNKITLYSGNITKDFYSTTNPIEIDLGPIEYNVVTTISYELKIIPNSPLGSVINNSAYIDSIFVLEEESEELPRLSNTVSTNISDNILSASFFANKSIVELNDTLTYIIKIKNYSMFSASNIVFQNLIPTGTQFVKNSLVIGYLSYSTDLSHSSLIIDSINPDNLLIITYKVNVTSIPSFSLLQNSFTITYNHPSIKDPKEIITSTLTSNTVNTKVVNTLIFY